MPQIQKASYIRIVLPRMREWIEITTDLFSQYNAQVLPRMREWIEIINSGVSLPFL